MQPWFRTDDYTQDYPVPYQAFEPLAGPKGVALVRVWDNGKTDPGWGLRKPDDPENFGFMWRYENRKFQADRILIGYDRQLWNFAFVMRSMKMVCIDIDGKNGGLTHVGKLGMLPHTLAETSRSGDGYHLFYSVDDEWDDTIGFGSYSDRIGLEQGVDLRGTGCVFHYPQQRWNDRPVAPLPQFLSDKLLNHTQKKNAEVSRIVKMLDDPDLIEELLMLKDELITDLAKPIPPGRRNNTLFAIGSKMMLAGVPNWDDKVAARAADVGLDSTEITKLLANIAKYGASTP